MSEDENPFENIPDEFASVGEGADAAKAEARTRKLSGHADFKDLARLAPQVASKGKLAMGAGGGFVLLIVLVYLGIVTQGGFYTYVFGVSGMVLSTLVAFFYMLDDLRIRPIGVSERGTKFVAGIIWALLLLLTFAMTSIFWPDYLRLIYLYAIFMLTNASFALFFYSMLWEE
jgi:hypothetical protein